VQCARIAAVLWTHRRTHVTQRGEAVLRGSNAGERNV
jgi:hypothetical protein